MADADRTGSDVVRAFLRAMQRGPDGLETLLGLFADDAVYVESLTGGSHDRPRVHRGKAAIGRALRAGLEWNPPDFTLQLDRLHADGDHLIAAWTCRSEALPGPVSGLDHYTVRGGRIARLETRVWTA
jgi:ketosteroid isomerase-like protein